MSDARVERDTTADKLTVVLGLADACKQNLHKLGDFQDECARQFRQRERELIEQLSRLQALIEEYLPIVGGDLILEPVTSENDTTPRGLSEIPGVPEAFAAPPPNAGATIETHEPAPAETQPENSESTQSPQGNVEHHQELAPSRKEDAEPSPAGSNSKKLGEEETKELFRTRYPAFTKLYPPAKVAIRLSESSSTVPVPRSTLEAITTVAKTYRNLSDTLLGLLEHEETGKNVLRDSGRKLMNQLQELDKYLETAQLASPLTKDFRSVREGLWAFIKAATDDEYREIAPPPNEDIGSWIRKQSYPSEDQCIESQPIRSGSYRKDVVVKTLRPGYVRMSADRKQVASVPVKARVQISTGSAY
ncbi:MAG: hypothetical protein K8U57_20195 [Planctomycetes bacterium]|nr:hypothetical protein [Planctomycetota bacterium]